MKDGKGQGYVTSGQAWGIAFAAALLVALGCVWLAAILRHVTDYHPAARNSGPASTSAAEPNILDWYKAWVDREVADFERKAAAMMDANLYTQAERDFIRRGIEFYGGDANEYK